MEITNEKKTLLLEEESETHAHILTGMLKESKRKLGNLIIVDLLVCPLLFAIVVASLWIELGYPNLSSTGICYLLKHLDGIYVIASLILWIVSHLSNLFLQFAVFSDNVQYCKTYGATLAPLLEILILFFFCLMMWSSLSNLPNYTVTKFLIVSCSVIALVANFYNYFTNKMAEHFQLLARFKMMKYKMAQAV